MKNRIICAVTVGVVCGLAVFPKAHGGTPDIREIQASAEKGDVEATFALGRSYLFGNGVPKDEAKAVVLLREAALKGHLKAECDLGVFCLEGVGGTPKDPAEAAKWFRKAAEGGLDVGQYNLGILYSKGSGVPKDMKEAVAWMEKAAGQGLVKAQAMLGRWYFLYSEAGVPKDEKQATYWVTKAAEGGDAWAQVALGSMYEFGREMPVNRALALLWYRRAAEVGDVKGQSNFGRAMALTPGKDVWETYTEAYAWLKLAEQKGDPIATNFLFEFENNFNPEMKKKGEARMKQIEAEIARRKQGSTASK